MDNRLLQELNEKKYKIGTADVIRMDDKLWFTSNTYNCLFCMDIASEKIKLIGSFPNEMFAQSLLYYQMESVGDKIYFAPCFAKEIGVYDIKRNEFEKIKIDEKMIRVKQGYDRFYGIQKYNNFLFFIPGYSKTIIRLNVENHEVQYVNEWSEKIEGNYSAMDAFFWEQRVLRGNKLFLPFFNMNAILELNCDTLDCVIRKIDIEETGYSGICDEGDIIWLYTRQGGNLIGWNPENTQITKVDVYKEGIGAVWSWDSLVRIIKHNKNIELFGAMQSQRTINEKESQITVNDAGYLFARDKEDYIIFCERDTCLLTVIDKKSNKSFVIDLSTSIRFADMKKIIEEVGSIEETRESTLEDFLTEINDNKLIN